MPRVRNRTESADDCIHTSHMLFWLVLLLLLVVVVAKFRVPARAMRAAAIAEDCLFPRFGRFGQVEGGSEGKVSRSVGAVVGNEDKSQGVTLEVTSKQPWSESWWSQPSNPPVGLKALVIQRVKGGVRASPHPTGKVDTCTRSLVPRNLVEDELRSAVY